MEDLFLYRFDEAFERQLLQVLCSKWGDRLITSIAEDSFERPATKWFVKAVLALVQDTGKCPRDIRFVYQKLTHYHEKDTAITYQQLLELQTFCAEVEIEVVSDPEQVILVAATTVRKVEEARVVDEVETRHSEGGDLAPVATKIENLDRIGRIEVTSVTNSQEHLNEMLTDLDEEDDRAEVCPSGITEFDAALGGGLMRGDLACYLGNTGDGKSRALNGHGNVALGLGMDVFWASNELQRKKQLIQWLGASLVMDTGPLSKSKRLKQIAKQRILHLSQEEAILLPECERRGTWHYSYFKPDEATIEDVFEAFLRERDRRKKEIPVLCLDYLKRLKYPDSVEGDYKGVGVIAIRARAFAQAENIFLITAHQSKKREKPDHILTKDDCADSHNLPRELDFLATLNPVNGGRDGHILNGAKLRDAPPMEPFLIKSALAYGCMHENQVGWIPKASQPAYLNRIYDDIDFGHVG